MSAYGVVVKPAGVLLPSTLWPVGSGSGSTRSLTVHHLTLTVATDAKLFNVLHEWFAQEVEQGLTYPQEGEIGRDKFEEYFFAGDVFVAIVGCEDGETDLSLEGSRCGRSWDSCIALCGWTLCSMSRTLMVGRSNRITLGGHGRRM